MQYLQRWLDNPTAADNLECVAALAIMALLLGFVLGCVLWSESRRKQSQKPVRDERATGIECRISVIENAEAVRKALKKEDK